LPRQTPVHEAARASSPREIQVAVVIWEGLTNCEIGRIIGTSGEVMKVQLCSTFDTLGIWSRLELAM